MLLFCCRFFLSLVNGMWNNLEPDDNTSKFQHVLLNAVFGFEELVFSIYA